MAAVANGLTNGNHDTDEIEIGFKRFSDIPRAIDIPVSGGDAEEAVEVELTDALDDPTELCTLLDNENVAKGYWIIFALAYAKQDKLDFAIDIINRGLDALSRGDPNEKLSLYNCLCWMYLLKSRRAPRIKGETSEADRTKDDYLRTATTTLNDASRINPTYTPLLLARGVLCLLRAALLQEQSEKADLYRQAARAFEDVLRANGKGPKNMMAVMGRARALFAMGKYNDALLAYQTALSEAPDLKDPDPRIGIGCCFWALGYKDDAQMAWQRALELNPDSKVANSLLGIYHLQQSANFATTDSQFKSHYQKAMMQYTQKAFKFDNDAPLACAIFGSYFTVMRKWPQVEKLARKAIELTDVSAIASDGWYLLARKEHYEDELAKAAEYYLKADQARGSDERGYLPAKFGAVQLRIAQKDFDGAKFRLEKLVQQSKAVEILTLLGTLYTEDALNTSGAYTPEERGQASRKAIGMLENVRTAWKNPNKHLTPDVSVLLNLARLYEVEYPDRSLQCLQQVIEIELDELPDDIRPEEPEAGADEEAVLAAKAARQAAMAHLSPQLLNNVACFHYQAERLTDARDLLQIALSACVKAEQKNEDLDTDALVTTISYNLARTYEGENMLDEAKQVYNGLLERHSDYIDAKIRLTYILLRQSPTDEGPKSMYKLYEEASGNMEVRSLFGWFLRRAKKKNESLDKDQEQRLFKHTLQQYDKHDRYALVAMGNLYLTTAREMRRDTDQDKDKRHKMYERSVEFFDKALQLDPRNAYAAQGIAIAMVEDKKDIGGALQIFQKVRETLKDASVYTNLGHIYCELKQYGRGIENYEAALNKDRAFDPHILACLGRAWMLRGKAERNPQALYTSLDYSQRALSIAPDQIPYSFNVAFVQFQIATMLYSLPEAQRTVQEVTTAAEYLDEAIEIFTTIAKAPNPPFPRQDIEQRANMGRNTLKRQLERAVQAQKDYEERNAEKLRVAREAKAKAQQEAEEARAATEAKQEEARRKIREDREKMLEQARVIAEERAEAERLDEERRKDEYETDAETGEQRKKKKTRAGGGGGKRKKKSEEFINDDDEDDLLDDGDENADGSGAEGGERRERPKKKKRRLERKSGKQSKYKSAETVEDSDLDDDEDDIAAPSSAKENGLDSDQVMEDAPGDEDEDDVVAKPIRRRVLDDDEDDDEAETAGSAAGDVFGEDADDE